MQYLHPLLTARIDSDWWETRIRKMIGSSKITRENWSWCSLLVFSECCSDIKTSKRKPLLKKTNLKKTGTLRGNNALINRHQPRMIRRYTWRRYSVATCPWSQGVHVSTNGTGILVIAFLIALLKRPRGMGENTSTPIQPGLWPPILLWELGENEPAASSLCAGQWTEGKRRAMNAPGYGQAPLGTNGRRRRRRRRRTQRLYRTLNRRKHRNITWPCNTHCII